MAAEFHLYLPQLRLPMDEIVARAETAERAGFTGMAMMDHLEPPGAPGAPMFEAVVTAAWLAARTERLTVGHLVLCDAFRHPAVLAKQAVTLDHASGGRFELGLGWGSVVAEIEAYGVGDPAARTRVERLAETLEVLRLLWSGEQVSYEGKHHTLRDVCARPAPLGGRVPVVIGGTGPRTLELVSEYADWWNLPVTSVGRLEELRPKAGKARVSVQQLVTFVGDEAAREETVATARRRYGAMAGEGGMATGNARELTAHFKALADRGVERFYVWFTDFARPATLEAFGEVVGALA